MPFTSQIPTVNAELIAYANAERGASMPAVMASDLGWRAGEWPFEFLAGDVRYYIQRREFVQGELISVDYASESSMLKVFND